MGIDITEYKSHPDKLLTVHTKGVTEGVRRRTKLKLAEIAAIFHDLGKINPNFQRKLFGKATGYTSHSYLSALAWLCFCYRNKKLVSEWLAGDQNLIVAVTAVIAHHHGNLPDLATQSTRIFKTGDNDPTAQLKKFLASVNENDLPLSNFLQLLQAHNSFTVFQHEAVIDNLCGINLYNRRIPDPLELFVNTQFGFASLIESDKRDAGCNTQYNREKHSEYIKQHFLTRLEATLQEFEPKSELDELRTEMRKQAVSSIRTKLTEGKRVFTLSAPTGAGKTLMLLRLAAEIMQHDLEHKPDACLAVTYTLPFLTITEQTEAICRRIYSDNEDAVLRVDSKSENKRVDEIQKQLEANPNEENLRNLMSEIFSEHTFDHPFIITTFVQIFETLISNRNSTLLRLPNFARTIFLIDEIQALPPRLYTFFTAYLDEFCQRFDSYAVISTATMPFLEMKNEGKADENPLLLFKRYTKPCELLDSDHFKAGVFNRYRINRLVRDDFSIDDLAQIVSKQTRSSLIVLNTIKDTQDLYEKLAEDDDDSCCYVLLNTHFTPRDRRKKIRLCKRKLKHKKRVVLISTQLIEAGVDIDFPVLYRDMCPLPNVIQSSGRCNRNGENLFGIGEVYLFELIKERGKSSSELIYGRTLEWFLKFTREEVKDGVIESEMFEVQRKFFDRVSRDLVIGLHEPENSPSINMVKCINELAFEQLGRFRLIDDESYREEFRFFVPRANKDRDMFEDLENRVRALKQIYKTRNFKQIGLHKSKVEELLRKMSLQIVNARVAPRDQELLPSASEAVAGIRMLTNTEDYSKTTGLNLSRVGGYIF